MEGYRRFKCSNIRTFCEACRRRIKVDEWVQAKPPEGHKGWRMTRCYPSCQEALTRAYVPPDPKRMAELLAPKIRTFRFKVLDRYPRSACVRCFRFFEDGEMIDAEVSMGSIWRNLRHHTRCAATLTNAVMMRNVSTPNLGNPSTPTRGNSSTSSRSSALTPNRGSALASGHGNALTPGHGDPSTPSRGSASTPTCGNSSTSSPSYASSTLNRVNSSASSPSYASSTPTRGRALTPIGTEHGRGAWRTHESEKRRLSFPAPRVLFGTDHMINEAEPPRSRRRLCLYTSDSARISFSPSSSAFSSSSAVTVTGALKDDDDDADGVECLGDVGIDEQLAQRQKEQGVVDLTGEFNAVG